MEITKINNLITISSFVAGSEQGLYQYEKNKNDSDNKTFKIRGAYGPNSPLGMVVEELKKRLSKNLSAYLEIDGSRVSVEGFDMLYKDPLDLECSNADYCCLISLVNDETIYLAEEKYEITALVANIWDAKAYPEVTSLPDSPSLFIAASISIDN